MIAREDLKPGVRIRDPKGKVVTLIRITGEDGAFPNVRVESDYYKVGFAYWNLIYVLRQCSLVENTDEQANP